MNRSKSCNNIADSQSEYSNPRSIHRDADRRRVDSSISVGTFTNGQQSMYTEMTPDPRRRPIVIKDIDTSSIPSTSQTLTPNVNGSVFKYVSDSYLVMQSPALTSETNSVKSDEYVNAKSLPQKVNFNLNKEKFQSTAPQEAKLNYANVISVPSEERRDSFETYL